MKITSVRDRRIKKLVDDSLSTASSLAGVKLTPAVLQFVIAARITDPGVRADRLAEWVHLRFGVHVHPRSIERQLLRKKKRR